MITRKSSNDGKVSYPYLIRSYDHEKRILPNLSRELIGTSRERLVRPLSDIENGLGINYGKAQKLEIWQVARAATASPFYFAPLRVHTAGSVETFGQGVGFVNPTRTSVDEVKGLYGYDSIGVVVSIETALSRPLAKRKKRSTVSLTHEYISMIEESQMEQEATRLDATSYDFPTFRIKDLGGLPISLDDWRPRQSRFGWKNQDSGQLTVRTIMEAFAEWVSKIENIRNLQKCASMLVAHRRKRMHTAEWERYATGCQFECPFKACYTGVFLKRRDFRKHLSRHHKIQQDVELDDKLYQCTRRWQYKTAGHQGTTNETRQTASPTVQAENQIGVLIEPVQVSGSVVDRGLPNMHQEDAKKHLLDPPTYFSELKDLEMDVAVDCRIRSIFPDTRKGTCQSVDLEQGPPDGFLESPEPQMPGPYRAGIPAALLASKDLMTGVMRAYHRLREKNFCGNCVNLIVASQTRSLVAETIQISRGILENILRLLQEAVIDLREQADGLDESIKTVETASEWTLNYLGLSSLSSVGQGGLQRTTELVQLLCLGLTSYAGSHASDFDKSCLDLSMPVSFKIGVPDASDRSITLQREKLSCLDEFVGGSVWVFSSRDKGPSTGQWSCNEARLAVSTSVEELADLWGPAWIPKSDDCHLISHINVERGIIYQPRVIPVKFRDQLSANEVACHWRSWKEIEELDAKPFTKGARLLIGVGGNVEESRFAVNPECSKTNKRLYEKLASENEEIVLNTDRARHALETHSLNLAVSKIVHIGYTASFKRIPARTLKAMLILDWSSESPSAQGLDAFLGLEISACTGNAQRVKLWEILNVKEVQDFIQVTMVDDLPNDVLILGFWDAFRKDFDHFILKWNTNEAFRVAARRVIRKLILKLDDTGIDEDKELRAWWPDEKAHRAFKIKPDDHKWVHMLEDSNTTAVFAIISTKCLQYSDEHGALCSAAAKGEGHTVLRTAVKLQQSCLRIKTPRTPNSPNIQSVGTFSCGPDEVTSTGDDSALAGPRDLEARLNKLGNASREGKTRENGTPNHPICEGNTSKLPQSSQNQGESSKSREDSHRKKIDAEHNHKTLKILWRRLISSRAAEIKNRQPCKSNLKPGDVVELLGKGQLHIRNANRPQLVEWKAKRIYSFWDYFLDKKWQVQCQELLYDDPDSVLVSDVAVM